MKESIKFILRDNHPEKLQKQIEKTQFKLLSNPKVKYQIEKK